jgi:hypothetical protein
MLLKVSMTKLKLAKQYCRMQAYLQLVNQYGNGVQLVAIILISHCALQYESRIRADLQASRKPGGGDGGLAGKLVNAWYVGSRLRGRECWWRVNATSNAWPVY